MDKELIKIDDLVRQRLGGVEERERPGGWASMRDLLDKEMPQVAGPVTKGGNSRIWRYTVGLLILSSAVAGGYALLNRPAAADGAPVIYETQTAGQAVSTGRVGNMSNGNNSSSFAPSVSVRNNKSFSATPDPIQTASVGRSTTLRRVEQPAVQQVGFQTKAQPSPVSGIKNNAGGKAAKSHGLATDRDPKVISTVASYNHREIGGTETGVQQAIGASGGSKELASLPLHAGATTPLTDVKTRTVQPSQPKNLALVRDTIYQMRVVSHMRVDPIRRTAQVYSDTQALQVVALEKWVLTDLTQPAPAELSTDGMSRRAARKLRRQWAAKQPKTSIATVAAAAPRPAQSESQGVSFPIADAAATKANTEAKLVPLSASRVDSRRSSTPWSPSEQFQSLVQNAKAQLAQTKYYMGLIAGINSTVAGAGSLSGFHFGVTGLMALNERIALAAELKYFQRFNYSSILRDDYYKTTRSVDQSLASNGQTYSVYRFDRDSSTHSFKFSNMASLELPLSARYTIDRFSLLAGVNLGYHFRVDAEEGGVKYGTINRYDTVLASQPAPLAVSRAAEVSYDDFRARFSVGYLVGATYQLSPAVSLDLRLAQQLWNTYSNTPGARTVSKTYYQLPNLQLSVGYRFQQQPKQPKQ